MILGVTAFVPIPGHPRSKDEYVQLSAPLRRLASEIPLLASEMPLENCWLHNYLSECHLRRPLHAVADNPDKNTLAYHIVQAQKTEFLLFAAKACNWEPDVYVWIDYGIFHVPGVTTQIIKDFLMRAENERAIAIPGCWDEDYEYNPEQPCWRFCGGVMVVPREYVTKLDTLMKVQYIDRLETANHVSWEVNMLAQVERKSPLPIWWYKADHDQTLFTAYKSGERCKIGAH